MGELTEKLLMLSDSDEYPFHMPGHKRRTGSMPEQIDITEIHGFDDLHDPDDVLLRLQERLARLWGAKYTWIGVNGSTGMILSSIFAVKRSGHFLIARNCHKSVYHACEIAGICADYLIPFLTDRGLFDGVRAGQVREALKCAEQKGYAYDAVVLTSPTYEGLVSEIREIAELLKDTNTLLIVDEAHGAHLPFWKAWATDSGKGATDDQKSMTLKAPDSALFYGADLVIESTHKTLPALTQTALLHAGAGVSEALAVRICHYLNVFQTSSPSYVFMSSLDRMADLLESGEGLRLGREYVRNLLRFYRDNASLKHYHLLENDMTDPEHLPGKDPSKLVIFSVEPFGGAKLADQLREHYHLEIEMEAPDYVIAMTSLMDSAEGFDRLTHALRELDVIACDGRKESKRIEDSVQKEDFSLWNMEGRIGERIEGAGEALSRDEEELLLMSLEECVSKSAEEALEACDYVWLYPPGIPFLVPGERILPSTAKVIRKLKEGGYHICGMRCADGRIYVKSLGKSPSGSGITCDKDCSMVK